MEIFSVNPEELRKNVKIDCYGSFAYQITLSEHLKMFDYPVMAILLGAAHHEHECFKNKLSENYLHYDYIYELKNRA